MLALHFGQRIPHGAEKILVRGDDGAVHVELDHGLGAIDRSDLAGGFHAQDLLRGNVGGELDHLEGFALGIQDRIVRCLDPDLLAALGDALVLRGLKFAAVQLGPEFTVIVAVAHGRFDEHAVMLALDLVE